MSGFTKLHHSLLDSTIWRESDQTRILWITVLAMADMNGTVQASIPGLADRARLSIEQTETALKVLMSPDPYSRTKDDDGRRMTEIDGGWMLTNHAKYRDRADPVARREYLRVKKAESRAATAVTTKATTTELRSGYVFFVAAGDLVKIAFSANPWARLSEMKKALADAEIIGIEEGTEETHEERLNHFFAIRTELNWHRRTPEIVAFAESLMKARTASTTKLSTTSTHTEAEAEADQKVDSLRESTAQPGGVRVIGPDEHVSEQDLAAYNAQCERELQGQAGGPAPELRLDGQPETGKDFPWAQFEGMMRRILPEIVMRTRGDRRDFRMKQFWRKRGKSIAVFEVLAQKVKDSDYLMARNGHTGQANSGRPYQWSWIFDLDRSGKLRADRVMDDEFTNDRMEFVLAKAAKAKLTKVMMATSAAPVEVNLDEEWEGAPRYRVAGTAANGLPDVIDYKA